MEKMCVGTSMCALRKINVQRFINYRRGPTKVYCSETCEREDGGEEQWDVL